MKDACNSSYSSVQVVTGLSWAGTHTLMSSALDNKLKRWDTTSGSAVDTISTGKALLCCASSVTEGGNSGGALVATGAADGSLRWWDCRAGAKQREALVRSLLHILLCSSRSFCFTELERSAFVSRRHSLETKKNQRQALCVCSETSTCHLLFSWQSCVFVTGAAPRAVNCTINPGGL